MGKTLGRFMLETTLVKMSGVMKCLMTDLVMPKYSAFSSILVLDRKSVV